MFTVNYYRPWTCYFSLSVLCIMLMSMINLLLISGLTYADTGQEEMDPATSENPSQEQNIIDFEVEWDAYYSSAAAIFSLTDEPVPDVGTQSEFEVYKGLIKRSFLPRFILFEASINPMPCAGVFIRKNYKDFYKIFDIGDDFNLIKSMTAGFEEPYAFSFFMGNVVRFSKPGEKRVTGNNGYIGFLVSAGDHHIKDNVLINDHWYEVEGKIKGDRKYSTSEHNWSFRLGTKVHGNPYIADVYYFALRRSRVNFEASPTDWFENSGIEYKLDIERDTWDIVQQKLLVDRKWPFKNKLAFTLTIGLIRKYNRKYSGELEDDNPSRFEVVLIPNIQF